MVGRRKNEKWIWRIKDQSKASSSSPPQPSVPWIDLPRDITENILQRLGAVEILDNAYKCAVDRSQGQLVDLSICGFGCDELLFYIAQRSSHLVCLRLEYAGNLTGRGLAEATERFPLLEVLHISIFSIVGKFIEQVGHSCPLLKSFTLNKARTNIREPECDDTEALAIAKTMSGLRHLGLFGNLLSNRGLVAILDGCEHLESLDLRLCYGVDLTGDLGKRCSLRLKSLTKPDEFTVDHRPAGR
ncbi:hypothetical protein OROHE_000998 [Orobanche hederae]